MNRMGELLQQQRETMDRFELIEARNGLLEWAGTLCTIQDFSSPRAQAKVRRLAWAFIEEIGEALDAAWCGSIVPEEFADAFHYLLELLLVTQTPVPYETLEEAFEKNPIPALKSTPVDIKWMSTLVTMTSTINLLKNRPHKRAEQWRDAEPEKFREKLVETFDYFICALKAEGFTADTLAKAFYLKAGVNKARADEFTMPPGTFGPDLDEYAETRP